MNVKGPEGKHIGNNDIPYTHGDGGIGNGAGTEFKISMDTPGEVLMSQYIGQVDGFAKAKEELGLPQEATIDDINRVANEKEQARKRATYDLPPEATQEQLEKASRDSIASNLQAQRELGPTSTREQVEVRGREIRDGWGPAGNPEDITNQPK